MSSVQLQVIDQVKISLDELATSGVLKRVYTEPKAIGEVNEFPYAFFRIGADEEYPFAGHGWLSANLRSRILVTLVIQRESTYATRELAELIDEVRRKFAGDNDAFCAAGVTVVSMQQIDDPKVSNFFDDFATATLAINYAGIDDYQ